MGAHGWCAEAGWSRGFGEVSVCGKCLLMGLVAGSTVAGWKDWCAAQTLSALPAPLLSTHRVRTPTSVEQLQCAVAQVVVLVLSGPNLVEKEEDFVAQVWLVVSEPRGWVKAACLSEGEG
jgi:hypothetical protein